MAGESRVSGVDAPIRLAEATEAVRKATEAVQTTSRSIARAVGVGRRTGIPPGRLVSLTRGAPLQFVVSDELNWHFASSDDAKAEIRAAVRYLLKGANGNNRHSALLEIIETVCQVAAGFLREGQSAG